jgi:transcriptional regulator with XRE-family HTH domain
MVSISAQGTVPKLTKLAKQIRVLRKERNMTQEALASKLSIDKSAVAHWETGNNAPRSDMVPRIAEALEVSVAQLYGEAA